MQTIEQALVEKIKAGYPAIYLLSAEEQRSRVEIQRAAEKEDRTIYTWTFGEGLATPKGIQSGTDDPIAALSSLAGLQEKSIIVLRQFHHFLEDPLVQIKILDLIPVFKTTRRMLVVLSPVLKIPKELEKELALVEANLPDEALLEEALNGITDGLPEDKKPEDEIRKVLIHNALGLTTAEAENAFALSAIRPSVCDGAKMWDPKVVMAEKCSALKKEGLLEFIPTPDNGEELIGGLDNLKEWVKKRKRAFTKEAIDYGLGNDPPKGVLLVGPPGTGKSLGAKAFGSVLGLSLLRFNIANVFGGIVGESEENIRRVTQTAERMAPCILWIDEIEKGLAGTSGGGELDSGVGARVLGSLLTWMSEKTAPVFVYATSNDIQNVDEALLRRFDVIFSALLPNVDERKEIFKIHLNKRKPNLKLDIDALAEATEGFSGAEIEKVIVEAMYAAFDEGKELNMWDLNEAISNARPMSVTKPESIKSIERWCKERTLPANKTKNKTKVGRSVSIQ